MTELLLQCCSRKCADIPNKNQPKVITAMDNHTVATVILLSIDELGINFINIESVTFRFFRGFFPIPASLRQICIMGAWIKYHCQIFLFIFAQLKEIELQKATITL